ncbi:DNA polymerase domain-containing protein [Leptospira idonii]|uniref:DNA-directed DNA polymerase n=1 Tax=Leptospira idonii TaxID=1193500 RepID=A0A4R9M0L3_9LEPT|nr:DNA polymerase domain-containing protein [Leptospira idonii]TGN20203.1 DNA polymerase [Leptospira idonii]
MEPTPVSEARGYLFDVYHTEDRIYLWTKDKHGNHTLFYDFYQPIIYANGPPEILKKLVHRLYELDALADKPCFEEKTLFYENKKTNVLKLVLSRPSLLPRITRKLYALYGKFDIFHSDIDLPVSYMVDRNIYPLCKLVIEYKETIFGKQIVSIRSLTRPTDREYTVPPFKIVSLSLLKSHRFDMSLNSLRVGVGEKFHIIPADKPMHLLKELDEILVQEDPDILLSAYGDQVIFPYLFSKAQNSNFMPSFDRDKTAPIRRKIQTQGTSFSTYGTIVYRAPSYPLFGRWHIDSKNSFLYKHSQLYGIYELARMSRLPVQKMARSSTGKALTYIEIDVALRMGYLVPWQKSAVESPKTALQLLNADRGGLVFQPDIYKGYAWENVAQLDFAQMYPSIMVIHNISPECVNCVCCENDPDVPQVPQLGYKICNKRKGVVSEALEHVLFRRSYYKKRKQQTHGEAAEIYEEKQASLKWMLVTSFGYLGYRNAKFGRLESHESVNAFGREKLLTAKEVAEERGCALVHAITDSIFIQKEDKSPFTKEELNDLCEEIKFKTGIKMIVDGVYTWLLFPPSSQDSKMPVANRYMGRFESGILKSRGIDSRRKDLPLFIRDAQKKMVDWMNSKKNIPELKNSEKEILSIYRSYDDILKSGSVSWRDLLIRRSTSNSMEDYEVQGPSFLALTQLDELGMKVQAGEKIKYLVLKSKSKTGGLRYAVEEVLELKPPDEKILWDKEYYRKLLTSTFQEVWAPFASFSDFDSLRSDQFLLPFS